MSLLHSGSIHVVTNDAKFKRGLPSSMSSSLMIWYAASLGVSLIGSRYLHRPKPSPSIFFSQSSFVRSFTQKIINHKKKHLVISLFVESERDNDTKPTSLITITTPDNPFTNSGTQFDLRFEKRNNNDDIQRRMWHS